MLRQRVITAVFLLLVLLPALFYPSPEPFGAVAVVFVAAGAWEWARLAGAGPVASIANGFACAVLCACAWQAGWLTASLSWLWFAATALWTIGGAWLLWGGAAVWLKLPRGLRVLLGLAVLVVAWLAVAQARTMGINFLLSVLVLVWVADVFAYFSGRAWGGKLVARKLAVTISPGKSWEGVWGGMVGVLLLAVGWMWADARWQASSPSIYSHLAGIAPWFMVACAVSLAGMSVVGDLVESLVKRAAGAKDSSGLLPGHGGVLDRLDALLPALPMAMLLQSL